MAPIYSSCLVDMLMSEKRELNNVGIFHSGVGVTKPISSIPLFSNFFNIVKTRISYWTSCLYLTGVTAAQLRWRLSDFDVIQII